MLRVFQQANDVSGSGTIVSFFFEVKCLFTFIVYCIQPVVVCSYPGDILMVYQNTHYTTWTDFAFRKWLVAVIVEFVWHGRNHQQSFLEDTQPEIAVFIFEDGMDFRRTEVEDTVMHIIVFYAVRVSVVYFESESFGTYIEVVVVVNGQRFDT